MSEFDSRLPETECEPVANGLAQQVPSTETLDDSVSAPTKIRAPHTPATEEDHTVVSTAPPVGGLHDFYGLHLVELAKVLEGEQLGHFRLEKYVGGGGMGAVFRGVDLGLNRTVAVKVLAANPNADAELERRFRNEAQSAARLDHDNVARVHHVGWDRGLHYIVFEYIEGINIRDLVNQHGPLPLAHAFHYTLQICEALAHASQRDVVHRDIKPSNVVITPEGRAKLVDMGLARLHQLDDANPDLTASGVTLGTFDYISPEQARDPRTADIRSDLYSLGCTFFFMLTGRPPFPEGTALQKLLRHQGDDAPDPRQLRADLPEDLSRIARKLLAKSPSDRYQEPQELIGELAGLADRIGLSVSPTRETLVITSHTPPVSFLANSLPWLVPTLILLASVLVLDWQWSRREEPDAFAARHPAMPAPSPPRESNNNRETAYQPDARASADPKRDMPKMAPPRAAEPSSNKTQQPVADGSPGSAEHLADSVVDRASEPSRTDADPPHATELPVDEQREPLPDPPVQVQPERSVPADLSSRAPSDEEHGRAANPSESGADRSTSVETTGGDGNRDASANVVVAPEMAGSDQRAFRTLRDAASAAHSGDVIELRYSGPREEQPIKLANKRVTIRAGQGCSPQVVFRPGPDDVDPAQYPRSMLTVLGGDLILVNVDLELDVPRSVTTESLALIQTRAARSVRLDRCQLTIRNASHFEGVAFFDVAAPADRQPIAIDQSDAPEPGVKIQLEDCIARGDATFLFSAAMQPVDLSWKNGLFASDARFLELHGGPLLPGLPGSVQLDLRYVTCFARSGLVLAEYADDTQPVPLGIACSDSIIIAGANAALIELKGVEDNDRLRESVMWRGDRNFYEGFRVFWLIHGTADAEPEVMGFLDWQDHWKLRRDAREDMPRTGAVLWKQMPPLGRPTDQHTADEYALDRSVPDNPARGGAGDGGDVGFRARRAAAPFHQPADSGTPQPDSND